jgi:predicted membrane-bound spermidine synthase
LHIRLMKEFKSGSPVGKAYSNELIFISAFVEGFCVLALELLAGMIISSYYGSSHVAWALTLGFTLVGLAIGYFLGGILSTRKPLQNVLFNCFMISGLLTGLLPVLSNKIFLFTSDMGFYTGLTLCVMILIVPPIMSIGCSTSILIQLLKKDKAVTGKIAGKVYGISTLGGILSALLMGFFIIPSFGVSIPLLLTGLILIINAFFFIDFNKKKLLVISCVIFYGLTGFITYNKVKQKKSRNIKIAYESEGIMGQIKVLDSKSPDMPFPTRRLLINGIPQTYIVNQPTAYSLWNYPHFISAFASMKNRESSVLLIGFGGGSVARELKDLKFDFEVVEIDERIIPLAKKYFYFDTKNLKCTVDDARHFIKNSGKKYDLIIYDVLTGEAQPNYVFTIESLNELKNVLNPGGMVVINYQGIVNDPKDKAFYSLYKTFETSGFHSYYWATNPDEFDDIVFVISQDPVNFENIKKDNLNECCRTLPLMETFLKKPASVLNKLPEDIQVLTDDRPVLDQLNGNALLKWRKLMMKDITNIELEEGISIFK